MHRFISNHEYIINFYEKKNLTKELSSCIYTLIHTSKFQIGTCKSKS